MNNKQNFTDYKNLVNGPSVMVAKTDKGNVTTRVRTGSCDNWNGNENNLVSLDIRDHDKYVDQYVFTVLDMTNNEGFMVGWIFYDELIEKAEVVFEDDTIYLALPINKLRSAESLDKFLKKEGGDKNE